MGQANQHLILHPDLAPGLKESIPDAAREWNNACPSTTNIPSFTSSVGSGRSGTQTVHNSLLIVWRRDPIPDHLAAVALYSNRNHSITLAEMSIPEGGSEPLPNNWLNEDGTLSTEGWNVLVHEFGHSMGLGHDTCVPAAPETFSIMESSPTLFENLAITPEHCELANFLLCDPDVPNAKCPEDPRVPKPCPENELGNCFPINPLGRLQGVCSVLPRLCGGTGSTGATPWWEVSATQPELRCTSSWTNSCDNSGCTGTLTLSCSYLFRPGPEQINPVPALSTGPDVTLEPIASVLAAVPESSPLSVRGSAVDGEHGVREVALWLDDWPIALDSWQTGIFDANACAGSTDPNCPYVGFAGSLDASVLAPGPHLLQVVAVNDRVLYPMPSYTEMPFTVPEPAGCGDTTRPTVSVTSPAAGAAVGGLTMVSVQATDDVGVALVQLHVDGAFHATDFSPPWTFAWDTTALAPGSHDLTARAYDACGNNRFSAAVPVIVVPSLSPPNLVVSEGIAGPLVPVGSVVSLGETNPGVATSRRFRIENTGTSDLVLTNATSLVSGACFHQIETPATPVPPGGTSYFRVRLHCWDPGFYAGQVTIQSNDFDQGTYTYGVAGTVGSPSLPELSIIRDINNQPVTAGSTFDIGSTAAGTATGLRFRIQNDGVADLVISNPASLVSGTCFSLSEVPVSVVPSGGASYFRVRLYCLNAGAYAGTVTLCSNDPDEDPFAFFVSGTITE